MSDTQDPTTESADHKAMAPYWEKVSTIMAGTEAMRAAGETYLPKHKDEKADRYEIRRRNAILTNIFGDIVENLAQRPFASEVQLGEDSGEDFKEFSEDVDGRGTSLHGFAGEVFAAGISHAIDWIFVDFTRAPDGTRTRAQERAAGLRPYWTRYPATSVIAAYSDFVNGREQFVHVRLKETRLERTGFEEKHFARVRVLDREAIKDGAGNVTGYGLPTVEVWEQKEGGKQIAGEWVVVEPRRNLTIDEIPIVPFYTGRRHGQSWHIKPPMRDAADVQIALYQQESGLNHKSEMAAFPMLAGQGVSPQIVDGKPVSISTGPHVVLYAPPTSQGGSGGEWRWLEPEAQSLDFLAKRIVDTRKELREIGRQPLTAQSGNLTVVTTTFAAQKGNAAVQAWAINLAVALENAYRLTGKWLSSDSVADVLIDTDFDLGLGDDDTYTHVLALRKDGEISRDTALSEAKRRNILSPDFDPDDDAEAILEDVEDEPPDADEPPGIADPAEAA